MGMSIRVFASLSLDIEITYYFSLLKQHAIYKVLGSIYSVGFLSLIFFIFLFSLMPLLQASIFSLPLSREN